MRSLNLMGNHSINFEMSCLGGKQHRQTVFCILAELFLQLKQSSLGTSLQIAVCPPPLSLLYPSGYTGNIAANPVRIGPMLYDFRRLARLVDV